MKMTVIPIVVGTHGIVSNNREEIQRKKMFSKIWQEKLTRRIIIIINSNDKGLEYKASEISEEIGFVRYLFFKKRQH